MHHKLFKKLSTLSICVELKRKPSTKKNECIKVILI